MGDPYLPDPVHEDEYVAATAAAVRLRGMVAADPDVLTADVTDTWGDGSVLMIRAFMKAEGNRG